MLSSTSLADSMGSQRAVVNIGWDDSTPSMGPWNLHNPCKKQLSSQAHCTKAAADSVRGDQKARCPAAAHDAPAAAN